MFGLVLVLVLVLIHKLSLSQDSRSHARLIEVRRRLVLVLR